MPGERLYAHTDFERLFGNNKIARNEQTYRQQAHTHTNTQALTQSHVYSIYACTLSS